MTAATVFGNKGTFWRPSAALRVATGQTENGRLAAALVAAICAFTLILTSAPIATSIDALGSETRVAAQTDAATAGVGAQSAVSPVFVGPNGAYGYDAMSGCCVAPSGTAIRALDDLPFPDELAGGPSNVHVYFGVRDGKPVYTGITNNVGRRQAQHGDRFVLDPLTTDQVTRGQARAIEQALIERNPGFENAINSISPRHGYYQSAVDWGEAWLQGNGY